MFLGHFAVGLGAKKVVPEVPLPWLVVSAIFLDLLWPIFLLLDWESVAIVPGITRVTPLDFTHYPWTHSLVMAMVWGIFVGLVYWMIQKDGRGAVIVGTLVPSHWLIDLPVHRPDLPIFPLGSFKAGLGIWNSLPLTLILEYGLLLGGVLVYLKVTRARGLSGKLSFWSLILFLVVMYLLNVFGPPPPGAHEIGIFGLAQMLFIPWAWWIERTRELKKVS